MIIGANKPLVIGQRATGLVDQHEQIHAAQPFLVLREATVDEWIAEAEADGMALTPGQRAHARGPDVFFYEVSLD